MNETVQQYDMFGNLVKVEQIVKASSNKFKTMQEQYGSLEGHICKECYHHLTYSYHNRNYHKCNLWKISHSSATDIRCKDTACKKFTPGEREIIRGN